MKKTKKELTAGDRVAAKAEGFFANNFRILAIIAAIIVVFCIIIAVVTVSSSRKKESLADAVFTLERSYNSLLALDPTSAEYLSANASFIANAQDILDSAPQGSYASLKTNYLMGRFSYAYEDWTSALSYFETVAAQGSGTYLGALALCNAAAAAENSGDQYLALQYYNQVWDDYGHDAPESPKALFNSARLYELTGDTELALATYNQLADEFQSSEYAQLAASRILVLE